MKLYCGKPRNVFVHSPPFKALRHLITMGYVYDNTCHHHVAGGQCHLNISKPYWTDRRTYFWHSLDLLVEIVSAGDWRMKMKMAMVGHASSVTPTLFSMKSRACTAVCGARSPREPHTVLALALFLSRKNAHCTDVFHILVSSKCACCGRVANTRCGADETEYVKRKN